MATDGVPNLHWTQRIALIRHNLHSARRTNDFSFFKSLQAHALIQGTDYVAILYASLGDDADSVLSTLDNLNAGIAYVHQDAFKAVYDSVKSTMHTVDASLSTRKSMLRVDICQQRDMADHAIDKTTNSTINFIQAQPAHCQDAVANAWVTGTTIIADAVCVCLNEMNQLENNLDDFIRLEYSWNSIQSSVDGAISALRGIFSLMATPFTAHTAQITPRGRNLSVSSAGSDHGMSGSSRSRTSSTASAFNLIKRAFSHAQIQPLPQALRPAARNGSLVIPSMEGNAKGFRQSMSAAVPTKMSNFGEYPHTILTTIPPTPSVVDVASSQGNEELSPFKQDYFAFHVGKSSEKVDKQGSSADDMMQM